MFTGEQATFRKDMEAWIVATRAASQNSEQKLRWS